MTREELTAKLRKLTGKTADDIEALDERVDALEAGAGGGVEFNTLDVTVTYTGSNHMFRGFITSEIPDNIEINNIIKIEHVEVILQGENTLISIAPLPTLGVRSNPSNEFTLTDYESYAQMTATGYTIPLGLVFQKIDTNSELTELTVNYKITYV